jgi:calcineurin-like phosphoesterase family protein
MADYFWSDPHFFHKRILEFTDRPYATVEEMNDALLEQWNSTVTKRDRGFLLGDLSFGSRVQTKEILEKLNGQLHVIRGNHDDPIDRYSSMFASYQDYKEIRIDGQKIVLMHFPIESWHGAHKGTWHLHGHCHGSLPDKGIPRIDVGVDAFGRGGPLSFERIKEIMKDRSYMPVDHHSMRAT